MATSSTESGFVDNWQRGKSVTECNLHMLQTEDFTDVTFLVGYEKDVVRAHRYVLASRSCVFHPMFYGPLSEQKEVTIPDIETSVFRDFLRFLYTDDVTIDSDNVTGLLYSARKYDIWSLFTQAASFLKKSLCEENLCEILEKSHGYGETDVKEVALKMLRASSSRVIKSSGFLELCKSCFRAFLKSTNLKLKEEEVFEAVLSWTKAECERQELSPSHENMRKILGKLMYEIRFTSLSHKFLTNVVGPSGMLTLEERVNIMDRKVNAQIDISPFKTDVRKTKVTIHPSNDGKYYVYRFQSRKKETCQGGPHAISFSTDRPITLLGCQLYGSDTEKTIKLVIRLRDDKGNLISHIVQNTWTPSINVNDVMFPTPVSVKAGRTYTIHVKLSSSTNIMGCEGNRRVTKDGVEFTFKGSTYESDTTVEKGQIPALIWKHTKILK